MNVENSHHCGVQQQFKYHNAGMLIQILAGKREKKMPNDYLKINRKGLIIFYNSFHQKLFQ